MEQKISTNQAGLLLVLFTVALKLSVLPAVLSDFASNNSYLVCLFGLIIDFIGTVIILLVMRKLPNKNFFELLKESLSKPVAIIACVFLYFYFFAKCIIALLELHDYFIATLFEKINASYFVLVLALLLLFLFRKNFRTIGRLLQVFFWPMAVGLMFTLIYPISNMSLINLFPIFQDGLHPIVHGLLHTSFAFGDYMLLLMLMGHIDYTPKTTKSLIMYSLSIIGFIFNFYIVFVGCFGATTVNQTLALGELPLHNPYPATVGRLEWLTIIIWTSILLIQSVVLGKCSCKCFDYIFNKKDSKISSIVTVSLIVVILTLTYLKLDVIVKFATSSIFPRIVNYFQLIIIMLLLISYWIHEKKNKTHEYKPIKTKKSKEKANV